MSKIQSVEDLVVATVMRAIQEDRQAFEDAIVEELEKKRKPLTPEGANHQVLDLYERIGFNDALNQSIATIREIYK